MSKHPRKSPFRATPQPRLRLGCGEPLASGLARRAPAPAGLCGGKLRRSGRETA